MNFIKIYHLCSDLNDRLLFLENPFLPRYLEIYKVDSFQILQVNSSLCYTDVLKKLTAYHFVDFEISREKDDFLKTTIGHLSLNGGSNIVYDVELNSYKKNLTKKKFIYLNTFLKFKVSYTLIFK